MKPEVVTLLAELSKCAYASPNRFNDPDMSFSRLMEGEAVFFTDRVTDAQCYGVIMDGGPVLAFRGTSSFSDACADCRVRLQQLPGAPTGVKSHDGFAGDFLALKPQIDQWLGQIVRPSTGTCPLICTGHSLASGASIVAALSYAYDSRYSVSWAGFGCPRPGNRMFSSECRRLLTDAVEVQNAFDPVSSCIPPGEYCRVGRHVQLRCVDPFPDLCLVSCLGDHDASAYVKNLREGKIVGAFSVGNLLSYLSALPSTSVQSLAGLYYCWFRGV